MLFGEPTKKGAGLILWGDYMDLTNLYDTISHISDSSVLSGEMSDYVLGLNYDIRHAFQGMRESKEFGDDQIIKAKYFGEKILWPHFVIQVGLLRWGAGFTETNSEHQSNLFRLENILERSLRVIAPNIVDESLLWLKSFHGFTKEFHIQFLDEITYRFIYDMSLGKKRVIRLPILLKMCSELSPQYRLFEEEFQKIAGEKGCHPSALIGSYEWPEFEW